MDNQNNQINQMQANNIQTAKMPVLPLRDVVLFPGIVMPLFVGRQKSIRGLDVAMDQRKQVLLVAQRNGMIDDPKEEDLFTVGTVATILQMLKLPDGTVKILVEGEMRAKVIRYSQDANGIFADIEIIEDLHAEVSKELEATSRTALSLFEQYVKLNRKIPPEIITALSTIEDISRLTDTIAAHVNLKLEAKQKLIEDQDLLSRLNDLMGYLKSEIEMLKMERRIGSRVKGQMEKTQHEYYLHEQLKAIKKELGELESVPDESGQLEKRIKESGMSKEAWKKATAELEKLKLMPPMSAEATVSRTYLETLLNVPWKKKSKINKSLSKAQNILDTEHYGLEKVKERITEYLAVQNRVDKLKGPILCLVGPPGVGKTSLGRSIAHATGRKFVRMSLGGVRDEAEIRGHRRTYIGALPGKILHNLSKVGVKNPLFLLDEVDKMASDFRGDPASALLEVLDPEQNNTFNDHYLEVDYDLSDVMFVTTANTMDIPPPLLDRMEVINLSGYTEDEKVNIAVQYLIPKQLELNGLKKNEISISEDSLRDIIRYYTREAGVRNLERSISQIFRKVVKAILLDSSVLEVDVKPENLEDYLGVRKYRFGEAEEKNQVGQVTGLAWTEVGGELLTIEAALMPGKGQAIITGHLGEVMQESVRAAMSVVRSRAQRFGLKPKIFEDNDIHVHVPEGAIPKDGPSAGVAMCTALVSIFTGIPVKANVAMTGEITLRGEVLPIGGLKEKLLAARRGSIQHVIIPEENRKDLKEIPENVKNEIQIHPVRWIDDVLALALEHLPEPLKEKASRSKTIVVPKKQRASISRRSAVKTH